MTTTKLQFDEEHHRYTLNGQVVPSVTSIIDPLGNMDMMPAEIMERARVRGTAVHMVTEFWDVVEGDKKREFGVWDVASEEGVEGYLGAYREFKDTVKPELIASEQRLYCATYNFAGTLDRVFKVGDDIGIYDIKTGELSDLYRLQTAAYLFAYNENKNPWEEPATKRFLIQLRPNGRFSLLEHTDPRDLGAFVAALTLHNWRNG
jgi:hypothetical protein